MILDPIDQSIRDRGFNFVPFDRYLSSPFQVPTDPTNLSGITSVRQPLRPFSGGGGGGGDYAASLGLGPDTRGFIGNFQDIDPSKMYSYTPQGITIEDLTKNRDGDFAITAAPPLEDQSGYIKPAPEIFEPQKQNMFQKAFGPIKDQGARVFGGLLSVASGVPFLGSGLQAIKNQFENRPLGAAVIDEFGNVYDEEELNRQNALGGYYTDAARSARRRTRRIENMLRRQAENKKFSLANLQKLQAQEQKQDEIRQAAAKALQDENRDRNRGGYGLGYSSDFMEGGGGGRDAAQEATSPGSSGPGGSDTMGSFMDGGIVNMLDIYD